MYKCPVIAAAILVGTLLASNRVEAGASASAPSKNQHVSANQNGQTSVPITEYSSSSAKRQHKH
jgi:hypothetical protein